LLQIDVLGFEIASSETLGFLLLRSLSLEEFERGEITKGLRRAHSVVNVLPAWELRVEVRDLPGFRDHLIELLVVSAIGGFDLPVQLGRTRREHEPRQAALLTSLLKLGSEFAAAVDLQSGDGERHAIDQRVQEVCGGE
jgi:hypothetical protein